MAQGNIPSLRWKKLFSTCVVLAAPGYPEAPQKGLSITGPIMNNSAASYFIHSGTLKTKEGEWQTAGGRVLCAMGLGKTKEESRQLAYAQAEQVLWKGLQKRSDIGLRK